MPAVRRKPGRPARAPRPPAAAGTGESAPPESQGEHPTWRDVVGPDYPEPPLATREELLAGLAQAGHIISARAVRYWESRGVIPAAVRRWHNGATRAVYPRDWYGLVFLAVHNRSQLQGESLDSIKPAIHEGVKRLAMFDFLLQNRIVPAPPWTQEPLTRMAREVSEGTGIKIERVVVGFQGEIDGQPFGTVCSFVHLPTSDTISPQNSESTA